MSVFSFYEYDFPSELNQFESYLEIKKIKYKKKKFLIYFEIKNDNCKESIEVRAYYEEDKVVELKFYCFTKTLSYRKNIENFIKEHYECVDDHPINKLYKSNDYLIYYKNDDNIEITVVFENTKIHKKEEKEFYKKIICFSIIGVLVSALFIALYFLFKEILWIHVLTSVFVLAFSLFELYMCELKEMCLSNKAKKISIIIIPIIYAVLLSLLIFFFIVRITDGNNFKAFNWLDVGMIVYYLTPSYHVLIIALSGASYA